MLKYLLVSKHFTKIKLCLALFLLSALALASHQPLAMETITSPAGSLPNQIFVASNHVPPAPSIYDDSQSLYKSLAIRNQYYSVDSVDSPLTSALDQAFDSNYQEQEEEEQEDNTATTEVVTASPDTKENEHVVVEGEQNSIPNSQLDSLMSDRLNQSSFRRNTDNSIEVLKQAADQQLKFDSDIMQLEEKNHKISQLPQALPDHQNSFEDLPFKATSKMVEGHWLVTIKMRGKSYIYQDSLSISSAQPMLYIEPILPPSVTHEDALGVSEVYFNQLELNIPVISSNSNNVITLNYQGCDENGLCYPPQKYQFELRSAVSAEMHNEGKKNNPSLHNPYSLEEAKYALLSANAPNVIENNLASSAKLSELGALDISTPISNESTDISNALERNLLLGLVICFVLGIGLDLTPCVLPMLPIFSAMIVGVQNNHSHAPYTDENGKLIYPKGPAKHWRTLILQNSSYAMGLSLTYMVLGLLFSLAGASLHGFLQSPIVTIFIALLLVVCALACADVIKLQMPGFITNHLQSKINRLNTKSISGAFMLGMLSALIASPCTSAPLAGALLYTMRNGDMVTGALTFLAIGLGMSTPLFFIGIFGSKIIQRSGKIGAFTKRLLVIVLLVTAFFLVRHLLGRSELVVSTLLTYLVVIYAARSLYLLVFKRVMNLSLMLTIAVVALFPTYYMFKHYDGKPHTPYQAFEKVYSLKSLNSKLKDNYAIVVFSAQWCTNCKYMERTIFSQDDFINASQGVSRILVDITESDNESIKEMIEQFKVIGVPYYMTLDNQGKIIGQHLGLISKQNVINSVEFLQKLKLRQQRAVNNTNAESMAETEPN